MSLLITGGTGSLGRALVRRLLSTDEGPERIVIYSRGEHAQAAMRDEFEAVDRKKRLRFFIGDIRDLPRLKRAFWGVQCVIHAAALKRIEVGAYNPIEMVKTNVDGAINVIEAANDLDVEKVVLISSDKAWQPISPYGLSKAMAEHLFLNAYQGRCMFGVCRYGNVWKSAGSVVPTWLDRIKTGGPLRVTDPEATRFYMPMDAAVALVLNTLLTMEDRTLAIPHLPAYKLGDLLEAVAGDSRVPIEFTGLPDWEKLHEGMAEGNTSDKARRMSVDELRAALGATQ